MIMMVPPYVLTILYSNDCLRHANLTTLQVMNASASKIANDVASLLSTPERWKIYLDGATWRERCDAPRGVMRICFSEVSCLATCQTLVH